jgi:hypothetical protein
VELLKTACKNYKESIEDIGDVLRLSFGLCHASELVDPLESVCRESYTGAVPPRKLRVLFLNSRRKTSFETTKEKPEQATGASTNDKPAECYITIPSKANPRCTVCNLDANMSNLPRYS